MLLVYLAIWLVLLATLLVDGQLAHIDYIIGFDWGHVFQWSKAQPIGAVLRSAYLSIPFQVIIFALWCGALHRKERLYEVFWILFVSAFVTGAIFGFFPALGPAHALGLDNSLAEVNPGLGRALADVISIRSGMNSSADIQRLNGIVAFPSFHTICAIVFIYGFRRSIVWWAIVLLNMLMLMSVPAFGGHYLIDVLVGIVVALNINQHSQDMSSTWASHPIAYELSFSASFLLNQQLKSNRKIVWLVVASGSTMI